MRAWCSNSARDFAVAGCCNRINASFARAKLAPAEAAMNPAGPSPRPCLSIQEYSVGVKQKGRERPTALRSCKTAGEHGSSRPPLGLARMVDWA